MTDSYYFDNLSKAEVPGFHDSLIYNFTGDVLYNLTRESIQNIVDAKDPEVIGPVTAEFKLSSIPSRSLPNWETLREIFSACWRRQKSTNDQGIEFFKNAHNLLNENKSIYVLQINDYNTIGLNGEEDDPEGDYYKLMINIGFSNKGAGAGGTYGLGKGAYFVSSLFRTMFVSSIWGDNRSVFQAKLRLVPHEWNGKLRQGIGLFAHPAIRNADDIPEMFKRSEKGTSIFIIGFEETKSWEKRMTESVIRYFWLGILEGMLEVKIGATVLNAENIESKIEAYFFNAKPSDIFNPVPFYNAYKDGAVFNEKLPVLGDVELRILLQKNFPRRIEYFRNTGMVIQNKPSRSGKGFAGVFICQDRNGILRSMEDPTHSKWSKDVPMTTDTEEKKQFAEAEKELNNFIENSISKLTVSEETTSATIKDLDKYFYSPAEDNDPKSEGNPESIEGQIIKEETGSLVRGENLMGNQPKINIQVKIPTFVPGETGGSGGEGGGDGGDGPGGRKHPAHPDDEGSRIIKVNKNIQFKRSFARKIGRDIEHIVLITGINGDKFKIEVRVGTEDSFDTVDIKKAVDESGNGYKIERIYNKNNEVHKIYINDVVIPEEGKLKLIISFNIPGKYSLNLIAYEN